MDCTVFWDIENCSVPTGDSVSSVIEKLQKLAKVYSARIKGIHVSGNSVKMKSEVVKELVLETPLVEFEDIANQKPNAADISIIMEVVKLMSKTMPPHLIILVTGDSDFSKLINHLIEQSYLVVLVHPLTITEKLRNSVHHRLQWPNFAPFPMRSLVDPGDSIKILPPSGFEREKNAENGLFLGQSKEGKSLRPFYSDIVISSKSLGDLQTEENKFSSVGTLTAPVEEKKKRKWGAVIVPERFVPLLREVQRAEIISSSLGKVKTINSDCFHKCGYKSNLQNCISDASSLGLVKSMADKETLDISAKGTAILEEFKGVNYKNVLNRAFFLESVPERFRNIWRSALDLLGNKSNSIAALHKKLKKRGFDPFTSVNELTEKAVSEGFLYIDSFSNFKLCNPILEQFMTLLDNGGKYHNVSNSDLHNIRSMHGLKLGGLVGISLNLGLIEISKEDSKSIRKISNSAIWHNFPDFLAINFDDSKGAQTVKDASTPGPPTAVSTHDDEHADTHSLPQIRNNLSLIEMAEIINLPFLHDFKSCHEIEYLGKGKLSEMAANNGGLQEYLGKAVLLDILVTDENDRFKLRQTNLGPFLKIVYSANFQKMNSSLFGSEYPKEASKCGFSKVKNMFLYAASMNLCQVTNITSPTGQIIVDRNRTNIRPFMEKLFEFDNFVNIKQLSEMNPWLSFKCGYGSMDELITEVFVKDVCIIEDGRVAKRQESFSYLVEALACFSTYISLSELGMSTSGLAHRSGFLHMRDLVEKAYANGICDIKYGSLGQISVKLNDLRLQHGIIKEEMINEVVVTNDLECDEKMVPITFRLTFKNLGYSENDFIGKICICGSWDSWSSPICLSNYGNEWKIICDFPSGSYEYKYIVNDTDWRVDLLQPTATCNGITNNILIVSS